MMDSEGYKTGVELPFCGVRSPLPARREETINIVLSNSAHEFDELICKQATYQSSHIKRVILKLVFTIGGDQS